MLSIKFYLCCISYLLNSTIYSVSSFNLSILSKSAGFDVKHFYLLYGVYIFRFFGGVIWSVVGSNFAIFKEVMAICIVSYNITILNMVLLPNCVDGCIFMPLLLNQLVSVFFSSGLFPVFDQICIHYVKNEFGIIKLCGSLGIATSHILGIVMPMFLTEKYYTQHLGIIKYFTSTFFLPFLLLFIYSANIKTFNEKKATSENKKTFNGKFIIFYLSIICLGFVRCALTDSLTFYYEQVGFNFSSTHKIFFLRLIVESISFYIIPYVENNFSINFLYSLSFIFVSLKTFLYGFYNINSRNLIFSESCGAISSAILAFTSTRLVDEIFQSTYRYILIPLYYGTLNGISFSIFSVIMFNLWEKQNFIFEGNKFRALFLFSSFIGIIGVLLFFIFNYLNKETKDKEFLETKKYTIDFK
ncbi:hypothetical protein SLOPH_2261 [Spraguea lophii 42_110]|uniref:Major facilitator superfamily associated domain-containing protein n=1 Tax=Spraguea lophii (strain 42_110) TaxID=1358809 RepID=S7WB10_SPRLO|nr:hypothetical protein SLOPH_2261 [Spraguea lophii 42_110]